MQHLKKLVIITEPNTFHFDLPEDVDKNLKHNRVLFRTYDLCFTILVEVFTNHTSAENTYFTNHIEWTECKIIGFKPTSRHQIIRQSLLLMISIIIHFFVKQNLSQTSFFTKPNKMNCKDETVNHSNIYLLFDSLWCQKSIS